MHYAVIMAGGAGQRLWPLSRKLRPKQIIDTIDGKSLLRLCVDRIKGIFKPENILVITNQEYAGVVQNHLQELPAENIIGEPTGRDTANAIGLAAVVLSQRDESGTMAVFSADQLIDPVEPLQQAIAHSIRFIESSPNALITLGIKATSAHTGFGYLKRGTQLGESGLYKVMEFREKPNKNTARAYLRSGDYCWNSGMFFWRIDTILSLLDRFLPANVDRLRFIGDHWNTPERQAILQDHFPKLQKISIDYAVMEHAENVYMVELDCNWRDVGSFEALVETVGIRDEDANAHADQTLNHWMQSHNCIAISTNPQHLIAAVNLDNLIVVHTDDATLICQRDDTDQIKKLLEQLEQKGLQAYL